MVFCGDFISVVMFKYNCSYYKALQIIANDFNIISSKYLIKNKPLIKYSNTKFEITKDAAIQVEIKDFEQYELDWWARYGITEDILKKFKVYSCKNVFLNGELFHAYKPGQYMFGYYGGNRNGCERWKIYLPKNTKYKWLSNWKSLYIQGAHMMPKNGEYLVITKSMKDTMTLFSIGIPSISPMSETCFLTDSQYNKIIHKFDKVILFMDNDYTGICQMNKIRKSHPELYTCWIPRNKNAKDISDFYKLYGRDKTLELINYAKEKVDRECERRKETTQLKTQ